MNEQSIVPLFESVTKKFIVDYMYRGTTLDEGVIVEIDGVAVQKQSLGPNYLYIEFIIYGNVSPASQETGKIFEKAALNGLTFYFTEYVTVLNESDEFFDIREGDGQSLLFENDDVTGSGSDDSGIDSVKKNLVIVFVVGSLVIVLVLAFLRNSNKELRKKRWNLYESRGELPTHCLADDTMNVSIKLFTLIFNIDLILTYTYGRSKEFQQHTMMIPRYLTASIYHQLFYSKFTKKKIRLL